MTSNTTNKILRRIQSISTMERKKTLIQTLSSSSLSSNSSPTGTPNSSLRRKNTIVKLVNLPIGLKQGRDKRYFYFRRSFFPLVVFIMVSRMAKHNKETYCKGILTQKCKFTM